MDKRISAIIILLSRSLDRKPSMDEMARIVGLSRFRLSHLFKSETGISMSQYVRSQRMQKAGELLTTTSLSLKQVAYRLGVQDLSHFVRDFKKYHGLTPTQFRQREPAEKMLRRYSDYKMS